MCVPEMPASHAEHRTARDPGRGTLVPDIFRGSNGDARDTVCEGHVLAGVDATLHPLATVIAKSKLLVLPVYPAAWPQAKRHPLVQLVFKGYETLKRMYVIKKVGFRYRRAEIAGIAVVERLEGTVGIASAVRWLRNAHVAEHFGVEKPTQKLQSFFSRWSIKFSAEYYEAASLRCPIVKQQQPTNAAMIINLKTAKDAQHYA
jgi:hypothetical protein